VLDRGIEQWCRLGRDGQHAPKETPALGSRCKL
jgi:hypothetical protein